MGEGTERSFGARTVHKVPVCFVTFLHTRAPTVEHALTEEQQLDSHLHRTFPVGVAILEEIGKLRGICTARDGLGSRGEREKSPPQSLQ